MFRDIYLLPFNVFNLSICFREAPITIPLLLSHILTFLYAIFELSMKCGL